MMKLMLAALSAGLMDLSMMRLLGTRVVAMRKEKASRRASRPQKDPLQSEGHAPAVTLADVDG